MVIDGWALVREDSGLPVAVGDSIWSFRGEEQVLIGGAPPKHAASTGRAWVKGAEYFPGVFGLTWKRLGPNGAPVPNAIECA
jgi:hypothetical protein